MSLPRTHLIRQWIELFRALGAALLEVYRAEAAELKDDVRKSSIHLAWALGLLVGAGMVGFWTLATGIYFLIQLLALWLPLWGAAGVVLTLLVLTVLILVWLGYRRFRRWENPAETIRRRARSHRQWLEDHLLPDEVDEAEAAEAEGEQTEDDEEVER